MRFNTSVVTLWFASTITMVTAYSPTLVQKLDPNAKIPKRPNMMKEEVARTVSPKQNNISGTHCKIKDGACHQAKNGTVDFPLPLSTADRMIRAVTFWGAIAPVVADYFTLMGTEKVNDLMNKEYDSEALWDVKHENGAKRIYDVISDLKGFYVKAAQIISSRGDLFPKQYTETLSEFSDNLDPLPFSRAKAVVQQELLSSLNHGSSTKHPKEDRENNKSKMSISSPSFLENNNDTPDEVKFEDVFEEFDEVPLGAASVAQVHRAVLTAKYGGKEVAVKIQRPSIESKLMGDIANLKAISKVFRNVESLPFDYYTIFSELETQLAAEFDFVAEAAAMDRIYHSLVQPPLSSSSSSPRLPLFSTTPINTHEKNQPTATTKKNPPKDDEGRTRRRRQKYANEELPVVLPRPVPGLVSRRVLVMDYLPGTPLSRLRDEMGGNNNKKNSKKGGGFFAESNFKAKIIGRKLLNDLTVTFGRNILEEGFFHADPHPGNIFIMENGDIGLIDFGQVKEISNKYRETLAQLMVAVDDYEKYTGQQKGRKLSKEHTKKSNSSYDEEEDDHLKIIEDLALQLGIVPKTNAKKYASATAAIWLFGGSDVISTDQQENGITKNSSSSSIITSSGDDEVKEKLGVDISSSPLQEIKTFPQDLVLVVRSAMLIKAMAWRFNIPWNLAKEWAPIARRATTAHHLAKGANANNNEEGTTTKQRQNGRLFAKSKNSIQKFFMDRHDRQGSFVRRKLALFQRRFRTWAFRIMRRIMFFTTSSEY